MCALSGCSCNSNSNRSTAAAHVALCTLIHSSSTAPYLCHFTTHPPPPLPPPLCRRVVSTNLTLPLGAVFGPAEALLKKISNSRQLAGTPLVGPLFYPPADVHAVAKAAVQAATDGSVPAGVMDAWQVSEFK